MPLTPKEQSQLEEMRGLLYPVKTVDPKDIGEMAMFGFDPQNPRDVKLWVETGPTNPDGTVTDYSDDQYEIGGQSGQTA